MRNLVLALLLTAPSPALAAPVDDFRKLTDEYWAWSLQQSPVQATTLGVRAPDSLGELSLRAEDRREKARRAFLARLDAIPEGGLSAEDRVNRRILRRQLAEDIEANSYGQRAMLFTTYAGWHQGFAGLAEGLPFSNGADYRSYLKRLADYPRLNDEALAVSDVALKGGYVLPCAVLGNTERSITGVIGADPAQTRLYAPFAKSKPNDVSAADWARMQAEARATINGPIRAAYAKHADWYRTRYQPKCAQAVGVSAQPGGDRYYAFRVRQMTTTDMTPDQIHKLGLSEVARIRAEMETVAKKAGFASREAMIADLRTNPKYYAKTPAELMEAVALQAKQIDGLMPTLFGRLPRLPYGIKQIPAETAEGTTTAYYSPGSPESGIAGNYYVNTSKLDQRPLWEVPALSAHEAVPGHHHQIALQQELTLPAWRKHGAFFTAFVEGWGLYSERLGIEMGLYDTPAKDMGRLSYEMWRACRLVVDTGLHSKSWTKDQAVRFMTDNSALSAANIDAEVNRYISWPGQALAYKIGELKIRDLRARAERELGPRFDLKRFHDAVLGRGAVPLDVLDAQIGEWIAGEKRRA